MNVFGKIDKAHTVTAVVRRGDGSVKAVQEIEDLGDGNSIITRSRLFDEGTTLREAEVDHLFQNKFDFGKLFGWVLAVLMGLVIAITAPFPFATPIVFGIMTNLGIADAAKLLVADVTSPNRYDWIALGTDSGATLALAATNTALGAEISANGLARAASTGSTVTTTITNDTSQWQHTFNVTGTQSVREIGVFNASAGGTMLLRQIFAADLNLVNTDTLTITVKVQHS